MHAKKTGSAPSNPRPGRRKSRAGLLGAALPLVVGLAAGAGAAPITGSQALDFRSGTESLWGPGGSASSFGASGSTGGGLGLSYDASASSGTVSSRVRGTLETRYDDAVARGTHPVGLRYLAGSSSLATALGARIDVNASVDVDLGFLGSVDEDFCLYCEDYDLGTSITFDSNLGTLRSGEGAFTATGFGPNLLVAGGSVDIDVTQGVGFRPTSVGGLLRYEHAGSGIARTAAFALDQALGLDVDLDLDRNGVWEVSFAGLSLGNRFQTDFGVDLVARIWYDIVVASDEARFDLADITLLDRPAFSLGFDQFASLSSFQITVPEPAAALLLGGGLAGLAAFGRRRGAA